MKGVWQLNGNAGKYRGKGGPFTFRPSAPLPGSLHFRQQSLRFANKSIFVNEPATNLPFCRRACFSTNESVLSVIGSAFSQQAFFSINEPVLPPMSLSFC